MSDEFNKYKYLSNISKHCYIGHDQHFLCSGSVDSKTRPDKKCTCRCHEKIGEKK
jgi:hypothetical protein